MSLNMTGRRQGTSKLGLNAARSLVGFVSKATRTAQGRMNRPHGCGLSYQQSVTVLSQDKT